MRAFVNPLAAAVLLFLSSLPARAVRIDLAGDGVEQYFHYLEVYILPALVVITAVLVCGYLVGRVFNRRTNANAPAEKPSVEMEKEEGTAAFLKELRSTPPIRDYDHSVAGASETVGVTTARVEAMETGVSEVKEATQFKLSTTDEAPDVVSEAPPPSARILPLPPNSRLGGSGEPAMTSESTATAAALLSRISKKKSSSARRLTEVLDAPSEETSGTSPDGASAETGTDQIGGHGIGALLADAKSDALDRVPEALLLGELPKETPLSGGETSGADSGQAGALGDDVIAGKEPGTRRNIMPNFSLLAMVRDAEADTAGGEAEASSEIAEPKRKIPPGTPFEEVLDLTLDAASEGFPEEDILDLTQETPNDAPIDATLDLTDEAVSVPSFEGALELLDEAALEEAAARHPDVSSATTLEFTEEVAAVERADAADERPSGEIVSHGGLDLPNDLTPFMPAQPIDDDTAVPIGETGYGGAAESITFTLPENLQELVQSNATSEHAAGAPVEPGNGVAEDPPATAEAILDGDQGSGIDRHPEMAGDDGVFGAEPTQNQSGSPDVAPAAKRNSLTAEAEEAPLDTASDVAPPEQTAPIAQPLAPVQSEQNSESEPLTSAPTRESLVERILRRQMESNAIVEEALKEPAVPETTDNEEAPREALWASEQPIVPPSVGDGVSAATEEKQAGDGVDAGEQRAEAAPESASSPTDAFDDPLFLNELLGEGTFAGNPASETEAASRDAATDGDGADTQPVEPVVDADATSVDAMPPNGDPAASEEWAAVAEGILDRAPEVTLEAADDAEPASVTPASPIERPETVDPTPIAEAIAVPDEPAASGTGLAPAPELQAEAVSQGEGLASPDSSSELPSVAPPLSILSTVERPKIWHDDTAADSDRAGESESSVIEHWAAQPAVQSATGEDALATACRIFSGFQAVASALQQVKASLDEKMKDQQGLGLDDVEAMKLPGIDGLEHAEDRLGTDLNREIGDGAAALDGFNHVVDRLMEMAAAQDLDEGWNEIIRQRVSETLYTVKKVQKKIAAVLPPDGTTAEIPKGANAPSAMR